jgi:SAM-dependent MidA family methyltransferase
MKLQDHITNVIQEVGPISFRDFMEICLYDEHLGYYTSTCSGIGPNADFYTSPTMTPAFGSTLGEQIQEMWEHLGRIDFTIVEFGGGTGHLCRDILAYLQRNTRLFSKLRYCIIEKSPLMRSHACKMLPYDVEWYADLSEIGQINGCILSNELVDNFSVHRVVMQDSLMEINVNYQEGFTETLKPASEQLINYFSELNVILPKGFCTEVNLQAITWIKEISQVLTKGYLLTIDYGNENKGLYRSDRSKGSLLCYSKYEIDDNFYDHMGEKDITSHVNFSALRHWGEKYGFLEAGFTEQGQFLNALNFRSHLLKSLDGEVDVITAARKATWLTHKMLIEMGTKFKVLVQEKGTDKLPLTGFRHIYPSN